MLNKKEYYKNYYEKNKERYINSVKKYQQSEKGQAKIKEYQKKYSQRPDVKKRKSDYDKKRYHKDGQNKLYRQINKQIKLCIRVFCRDGKINVRQSVLDKYNILYGIDLNKIIKKLQPFPKQLEKYELDHIIPISKFNLTKRDQIKKAYNPNNLQLLTIIANRKKSNSP